MGVQVVHGLRCSSEEERRPHKPNGRGFESHHRDWFFPSAPYGPGADTRSGTRRRILWSERSVGPSGPTLALLRSAADSIGRCALDAKNAPYGPPGRHWLWHAAANSSAAADRRACLIAGFNTP